MVDSAYIQVPADSTGKRVETEERLSANNVLVERQRFSLPTPVIIDGDVARLMLVEMRMHTLILAQAFGITDDLDQLRSEIAVEDNIT